MGAEQRRTHQSTGCAVVELRLVVSQGFLEVHGPFVRHGWVSLRVRCSFALLMFFLFVWVTLRALRNEGGLKLR